MKLLSGKIRSQLVQMCIHSSQFPSPSALGSQTFKAMFERTWPFSLPIVAPGLVEYTIKSSKFVHYGEPNFQGHIQSGYGLFHYQELIPESSEIPTKVLNSFTTGSHTPKMGLFSGKVPFFPRQSHHCPSKIQCTPSPFNPGPKHSSQ